MCNRISAKIYVVNGYYGDLARLGFLLGLKVFGDGLLLAKVSLWRDDEALWMDFDYVMKFGYFVAYFVFV